MFPAVEYVFLFEITKNKQETAHAVTVPNVCVCVTVSRSFVSRTNLKLAGELWKQKRTCTHDHR